MAALAVILPDGLYHHQFFTGKAIEKRRLPYTRGTQQYYSFARVKKRFQFIKSGAGFAAYRNNRNIPGQFPYLGGLGFRIIAQVCLGKNNYRKSSALPRGTEIPGKTRRVKIEVQGRKYKYAVKIGSHHLFFDEFRVTLQMAR